MKATNTIISKDATLFGNNLSAFARQAPATPTPPLGEAWGSARCTTHVGSLRMVLAAVLLAMTIVLAMGLPAGNTAHATERSSSDGIAWVKSQVGRAIDYDGCCGAQCVDLVKAYYAYLGVQAVQGNGADYATSALPQGWTRVQGGQPQAGDIIVYSGNSSNPYGHVAIYESDRSTYHQNFGGNQYVQQVTYRFNSLANSYWGYIRPNWGGNASTAAAPSVPVTIDGLRTDSISQSNARLYATAHKNPGTTVGDCGIYLGTSKNSMHKCNVEAVGNANNYRSGTGFDIWYDLSDELKMCLNPHTTYYYKFYCTVNGVEYISGIASFTTK